MYNNLVEQFAVRKDARHIELLREAEQYRLLHKLNEQPKWINPMNKLIGLLTLKLKHPMRTQTV